MPHFRLLLTTALLLVSVTAVADLPSLRFDRIAPVGASAGATIDIEILGAEIDDVKSLHFDHPGLTAEHVKDRQFKMKVAADVPAGTYDVRLVGRWGISNPRVFAVSNGLQDIAEKEPNNEPQEAQEVVLNAAINGTSDGNGEDFFVVALKAGQRVTFDCWARRLESEVDASLELASVNGKLLASNGDYFGADPFIDFIVPEDGKYVVRVNDLRFRGGFPYRLVISDRPHVENVFPRVLQAGKSTEVEVAGRNLPNGSTLNLPLEGPPLQTLRLPLTPHEETLALGTFRFFEHPHDHSVLPTAATCTLNGFQVRPLANVLNAATMLVVDVPVVLDQEPNNDRDKPQRLELPAVVAGRFDQPRDADWFEIDVKDGGNYGFEVYSERINGRADPYLVVIDEQGNRVTELDDFGHRMNAFDGHLRDPSGNVGLTANKKYRVLVQDRYSRGGARFQYVLSIRKQQPDFFIAAIHQQNPGPGGTNLWKGCSQFVDLVTHSRDGFNGPVTVTAEGLPPGVSVVPATFTDSRATLVLTAAPHAADWTGEIALIATATIGDKPIKREVRPYSRIWANGEATSRPARKLGLAVRELGPFGFTIEPAQVQAEAGKPLELTVKATRHWSDFKAAINLLPLSFAGGFQMPNGSIVENATDAKITITVPNGLRPGAYTLSVLGQAQVPFHKDKAATSRPNTLVSLPSVPVTINVVAPAK